MSSDFLLIYSKTWQSIRNALKRKEMNLREAAVWMVQIGHPSLGWEWRGLARMPARCRLGGGGEGSASLFCCEDTGPY